MIEAAAENREFLTTLVLGLKLLLLAIIIYDLLMFRFGGVVGTVKKMWTSTPFQELRKELKYIIIVPVAFLALFFIEITAQGRDFTPPLSMALTLIVLVGWLYILIVPKKYAVSDRGLLIKGTFYSWKDIRTVEPNKRMDLIMVTKRNPLMPPSYMLTPGGEADEIGEVINKEMEINGRGILKLPKRFRAFGPGDKDDWLPPSLAGTSRSDGRELPPSSAGRRPRGKGAGDGEMPPSGIKRRPRGKGEEDGELPPSSIKRRARGNGSGDEELPPSSIKRRLRGKGGEDGELPPSSIKRRLRGKGEEGGELPPSSIKRRPRRKARSSEGGANESGPGTRGRSPGSAPFPKGDRMTMAAPPSGDEGADPEE